MSYKVALFLDETSLDILSKTDIRQYSFIIYIGFDLHIFSEFKKIIPNIQEYSFNLDPWCNIFIWENETQASYRYFIYTKKRERYFHIGSYCFL
jgi:hypothetical protein